MNDRLELPDDFPERSALPDGVSSSIEQQLRSARPRSPRLDWDEITSKSIRSVQPVATSSRSAGFSFRQLTLAVAASWVLGALVGGSYIYWSMPENTFVQNADPLNTPTKAVPTHTPPELASQIEETKDQPALTEDKNFVAEARSTIDVYSPWVWNLEEPLRARSLASRSTSRLTTVRQSPPESTYLYDDTRSSSDASYPPTPPSNRQQLMEQYMDESMH